jgi:hypothetical protein
MLKEDLTHNENFPDIENSIKNMHSPEFAVSF